MRKKLLILTLLGGLGLVAALALLPWWLGAALNVIAPRYGVTFSEYRRIGYTRFALEGVNVRQGATTVTASRVELSGPYVWLLGAPGPIAIDRWTVDVDSTAKPSASAPRNATPAGWLPAREQALRIIHTLEKWLPPATAGKGVVTLPGDRIQLDLVEWTPGSLRLSAVRWREQTADIELIHDARSDKLTLKAADAATRWRMEWESAGAALSAHGEALGQPWKIAAAFPPGGWLPVEATVEANEWSLPGGRLKLNGLYETVAGGARLDWKRDAFSVDVEIAGEPIKTSDAPPLSVSLHGKGDLDRFTLDQLSFRAPGIVGRLTEPVTVGRDRTLISEKSRFDLTVDLAKQPWLKNGRGNVSASVVVTPRAAGYPLFDAVLNSADAAFEDWRSTAARFAVRAEWPLIKITQGEIKLDGGDRLLVEGAWDALTRTLTGGKVSAQVGRSTAARWLPKEFDFASLNLEATAEGVWPAITHSGRLRGEGVRLSPLRPSALDAAWQGSGPAFEKIDAMLKAGGSQLALSGRVDPKSARIETLTLSQLDHEHLRLAQPVSVNWSPSLVVSPFELRGPEGGISGEVHYADTGRIALKTGKLVSAWFAELLELRGPAWMINHLEFAGSWDRGPLAFTTSAGAAVDVTASRRASVDLAARGDKDGLVLDRLDATMEGSPIVRATGRFPAALWPAAKPAFRIDEASTLELDVDTSPNAVFWDQLTAATGLVLTHPEVDLRLTGTLKKPAGEGRIAIEKIAAGTARWAKGVPDIETFSARLAGDRGGLAVESVTAKISGQQVRASGRLPIKDWARLVADPLALVGAEGEARIEIPDAEVAALARYAPAYLAPVGKLRVDVALERGGQLKGMLRLQDAATRPLGPLGILQEISAEILLDGRTVEFKQVRATTGGQPVTLTGTVALPDGKEPRLNLALKGDRLPFVRQSGLLVRGDLDLHIETNDADVTRIFGRATLRDSLFLMDVRELIPTGGARSTPGRRPPYFSVPAAPFNAWLLDVDLRGDRFLRLRTPVFNGVVSANFHLGGTLGDPRATGQATINQGQVLLPFANFTVRQGDVRLVESDPFVPRVSLIGTGRRLGYDLRMEIAGTADRPQLTFTSTPTLESDEVLLMVMAGEAPKNEITYTSRDRAAQLGAYLGQSLIGQLSSDPEKAERFTISVGERVSRQGRETYGAEYALNPRWSLVGEYDEFDEYNLGVKWKVFTEKKPKEEAAKPDASK